MTLITLKAKLGLSIKKRKLLFCWTEEIHGGLRSKDCDRRTLSISFVGENFQRKRSKRCVARQQLRRRWLPNDRRATAGNRAGRREGERDREGKREGGREGAQAKLRVAIGGGCDGDGFNCPSVVIVVKDGGAQDSLGKSS